MRQLTAALALASACILTAACSGGSNSSGSNAQNPAHTGKEANAPTTTAAPVAVGDLQGLLLSPDQINAAVGANGMTSTPYTGLVDNGPNVADKDCRVLQDPTETSVYAGSGWSAVRRQNLQEPGDKFTHFVDEGVVSFPSATNAAAFFDASTHRWPACANRQYTVTRPGVRDEVYTTGPVSVTSGTLSNTQTKEGGNGWACQRALTVRNNVAVDIIACGYNPADAAVNIAHQVAAKVG